MPDVKIEIHPDRMREVFDPLVTRVLTNTPPYNRLRHMLPQIRENLPKGMVWGSPQHALYLWCSCLYMRGGIESDVAMRFLGKVYEDYPHLFSPDYGPTDAELAQISPEDVENVKISTAPVANLRPDEIFAQAAEDNITLAPVAASILDPYKAELKDAIRPLIKKGLDTNCTFWLLNLLKLRKYWQGNPLELFADKPDYDELVRRIKGPASFSLDNPHGFLGFQEKMVSMIIYFYMDVELIPDFIFPPPIDFHALRMLCMHEVITAEGLEYGEKWPLPEVLAAARKVTEKYCINYKVSPLRLCDAYWLYSRGVCSKYSGNSSDVLGEYRARRTEIGPKTITWTDNTRRKYQRTCGVCPIEKTCAHCVPNRNYAIKGELILSRPHIAPPEKLAGLTTALFVE